MFTGALDRAAVATLWPQAQTRGRRARLDLSAVDSGRQRRAGAARRTRRAHRRRRCQSAAPKAWASCARPIACRRSFFRKLSRRPPQCGSVAVCGSPLPRISHALERTQLRVGFLAGPRCRVRPGDPAADAATPADAAPATETAAASPAVTPLAASASDTPVESAVASAIETPGTTSDPVAAEAAPVAEAATSEPSPQEAPPADTGATERAVDATATDEEPHQPSDPDDVERAFQEIYGPPDYDPLADPTLPEPAVMPGTYDPWEKLQPQDAPLQQRGRPRHRQAAGARLREGGAAAGAAGRQQFLHQPRPAADRAQQPAAGQAEAGRPGAGPLPAQRHAGHRRHLRSGHASQAAAARAKTSARRSACGAGSARATSSCRCSARAPCATCSAWSATRRWPAARRGRRPGPHSLQGLQLVDVRTQLLSIDSLREGAEDDYALVRDAWLQRRDYQIFGDRQRNGEDLPDYLRDEETPHRAGRCDAGDRAGGSVICVRLLRWERGPKGGCGERENGSLRRRLIARLRRSPEQQAFVGRADGRRYCSVSSSPNSTSPSSSRLSPSGSASTSRNLRVSTWCGSWSPRSCCWLRRAFSSRRRARRRTCRTRS